MGVFIWSKWVKTMAISPKRYGGHGDGSHGDGGQGDRGHGDNGDFVMVLAFEVDLNTGDSSAVPQGALLVFQVNLECFIDIAIIILIAIVILVILIVIIKATSTMSIIEASPACSACQS